MKKLVFGSIGLAIAVFAFYVYYTPFLVANEMLEAAINKDTKNINKYLDLKQIKEKQRPLWLNDFQINSRKRHIAKYLHEHQLDPDFPATEEDQMALAEKDYEKNLEDAKKLGPDFLKGLFIAGIEQMEKGEIYSGNLTRCAVLRSSVLSQSYLSMNKFLLSCTFNAKDNPFKTNKPLIYKYYFQKNGIFDWKVTEVDFGVMHEVIQNNLN